jgi:hypothetical protein
MSMCKGASRMQVLSQLEQSIAQDGFMDQMQRARECPHTDQGSEELDALLGSFVVITKEDAVEAMASYLAAWLSSVPEAQNMDPKKLQQALLTSVKVCRGTCGLACLVLADHCCSAAADMLLVGFRSSRKPD